jgi:hypothetical protein
MPRTGLRVGCNESDVGATVGFSASVDGVWEAAGDRDVPPGAGEGFGVSLVGSNVTVVGTMVGDNVAADGFRAAAGDPA